MGRIIVGADLREQLLNLTEAAELCDESGQVLGHVIPADLSGHGPREPQVSEEELDRREREPESLTTEEVLARLGKL